MNGCPPDRPALLHESAACMSFHEAQRKIRLDSVSALAFRSGDRENKQSSDFPFHATFPADVVYPSRRAIEPESRERRRPGPVCKSYVQSEPSGSHASSPSKVRRSWQRDNSGMMGCIGCRVEEEMGSLLGGG